MVKIGQNWSKLVKIGQNWSKLVKIGNLIALAFMLCNVTAFGQNFRTLVNQVWEEPFGSPADYDWSASVLDSNGNMITTGHSTTTSSETKLTLVKQAPNGSITWQNDFLLAPQTKNYGISVAATQNGDIFVAGASFVGLNDGKFDFLLLKYSSSGNLIWQKNYNGGGNGDDIPVAFICDSTGTNCYVTGMSWSATGQYDYWTMQIEGSSGDSTWARRYDYANLAEYPIGIKLDNNGHVVVSGTSMATLFNSEAATISYDGPGAVVEEHRVSNNGNGVFIPTAFAQDASGNYLFTGTFSATGNNFGIRTIKSDIDLNVLWQTNYNTPAMDSATAITTDTDGNVFVAGWTTSLHGGSDGVLIKYKPDGTLVWIKKRSQPKANMRVVPRRLACTEIGDVIVAYEFTEVNNSEIVVGVYSEAGNLRWEKRNNSYPNNLKRPVDLIVKGDNIYVTAIVRDMVNGNYYTYHLSQTDIDTDISVLNPEVAAGLMIVKFKPGIISNQFINDSGLVFGRMSDILTDTSAINTFDEQLGAQGGFGSMVAYKMHPDITMADSITTSRRGDVIRIPKVYNTLVLSLPRSLVEAQGGMAALCDSLRNPTMAPYIQMVSPNFVVHFDQADCDAHDEKYDAQGNLHSISIGGQATASIDVEGAWCTIGVGSPNTKVGIMDSGLRWSHEDLSEDGTFAGSVVAAGYDFGTGANIDADADNDFADHGTKVAGIIGAKRNNKITGVYSGIAGIAGGNVEPFSGQATDGVSLYALKVTGLISELITAFYKAAREVDAVPEAGYGVDVLSISLGLFDGNDLQVAPSDDPPPVDVIEDLWQSVHFANRAGVIVCASRGDITDSPFFSITAGHVPATIQEEFVISVTGSGAIGAPVPGLLKNGIDVCAPSDGDVNISTSATADDIYLGLGSTSGATPHASGVAALMVNYMKNLPVGSLHMVQEDAEYILEHSAKDILPFNYDDYTGYGLLKADKAADMIYQPNCRLQHFESTTTISEFIGDISPLRLKKDITLTNGQVAVGIDVSNGFSYVYQAEQYLVSAIVNHGGAIPENHIIQHSWPLHSVSTTGIETTTGGGNWLITPMEYNYLDPVAPTATEATMYGYVYHITSTEQSIDGWWPSTLNNAKFAYSLISCEAVATDDIVEQPTFRIFPNPSESTIQLLMSVQTSVQNSYRVDIIDASGRLLSREMVKGADLQGHRIDVVNIPSGIYACLITDGQKTFTTRFIKM